MLAVFRCLCAIKAALDVRTVDGEAVSHFQLRQGASDQKFRCSAEESFVHGPGLVINDDNTDVVDMAAFKALWVAPDASCQSVLLWIR